MKEFKKVLIAGNGDLSVGMGIESNTDLPFISIRQLLEKVEVGSDTLDKESIEVLTLLFTNLESLEVLEGACVRVRKALEKQQSTPWYDEDKLTERMDIIGQNGNEGDHYSE